MITLEELSILREREDHVEFKEAKHNYPFAGGKKTDPTERRHCVLGYIVALANEKGGRLVLGMADAYPHAPVGTDFAEGEVGALEDEIYERLRIRIHAEELFAESGKERLRVLVLNVPSRPLGKALRFEGVPLMRVGESLREMDDAEYFSILQEQDPDFSARICPGLSLEDLDENAVEEMRRLMRENRRHVASNTLPQLLSDLNLATTEGLTYAALILLGKSDAIARYLPQQNVVVEYRRTPEEIRYSARKEFREPLFLAINHIWEYLNQPASNPLLHIMNLPSIIDVPSFNEETIREGVLNACIHRSLQMGGDILIRQSPEQIEITNPGGFPYGVNLSNLLTVNSSPRSRLMAEVIEKTGLIERSGQGVDIMYANCIREGRSTPDYSHSDDYQVSLIIRSEIIDEHFFLFVSSIKEQDEALDAFTLVNLYEIRKHHIDHLYDDKLPLMLEKGYIQQHPYYKYVLGEAYFATMQPVKNGVCSALQLLRVYYALEEKDNQVSISEIAARTEDFLSLKQARSLVEKLVDCGFLKVIGKGRNTRYSFGM
jgi:ATP-dependent DNA helicase RecG